MIRCVRIWTGPDGNSDFAEGRIDLSQTKGKDSLSVEAPVTKVSFRETPNGGDYGWHQDPAPRLVLTLAGALRFTVKDGRSFVINPGDVLLAEDNSGTGHKWKLTNDQPWRRCYIDVEDLSAIPFVEEQKA